MSRRLKVVKGLLVLLITLTSLLVAVTIIAPWVITTAAVSNKIRSEVSRVLNCEFDFKHLELSFFPRPNVVLETVKINVPRQLSVSVKIIEIYPEILPLLTGNFALKKSIIDGPEVRIFMPESTPEEKSSSNLSIQSETDPSTSSVSNALTELSKMYLPITRGIVTGGSIELVYDKNTSFKLNDVEADLQNTLKNLEFQITATADMVPVSGSLTLSEEEPKFRVQLEIRDLDINSVRSEILAVAEENTAAQTVFDILKSGNISLVTVSGQANASDDFENLDTFVIQGQLMNGNVNIPGTELEMVAVKGDVKILHGILTGENIQAQWGNSSIQGGSLKLDLAKDPLPIRFETGITADMADIPEILDRIVQDQAVKNELAHLENVQGSAKGKLLLTGDTDTLKIDVSATDIAVAGRYKKIPYPLSLDNGSLSYDGSRVGWKQLSGSMGTSTFTAFSGSIGLKGANVLSVTSGTSRILLSELLPWIITPAETQKFPGYLSGGKGILKLSKVQLNGPLKDLSRWQFNIVGDLEDFVFQNLPGDPGPLKLGALHFTADPQTLEYARGQISVLDTALNISGIHRQYLTDFNGDTKWTFEGQVGQQTADWLSETIDMPAWLKFQPLSFAPSHLSYSSQGEQKLTAALSFQDDLAMSADLTVNANEVVVKKMTIKDQASQAFLAGSYRDPTIEVSFDGNLHESTVEHLFKFNPSLATSIDGKARIRLNLKNPLHMSFDGNLNGKNLYIPLGMETPLLINHIAVKGEQKAIKIESADLSWEDTALTLSGNINPNDAKSITFDLDAAADTIDVKKIMDHFGDKNGSADQKSAAPTRPGFISVPIKGDIRLKAEQFKTKVLTIQPLYADIRVQDNIVDIKIKKAELCGIPATGTIKISQENIEYHLEPIVQALRLNTTMNCLMNASFKADGTFDAKGIIKGQGSVENLLLSSTGYMDLSISDGHIYQDIVLYNVIKFINATDLLTETLTEDTMKKEGVGFKNCKTHVTLKEGKLQYENFVLDGNQLTIIGEGEVDMIQKQLDFTLLVAPQKAVNTILGHIPLVGGILQTMTTIPLRVKGPLENVRVLPVAPAAVKYELKEIMKETLGRPMKLIPLKK